MSANGFNRLFKGASVPTECSREERSERVFDRAEPDQTHVPAASPPDPEVRGRQTHRRYSAAFKRRILEEADQCAPGQLGALLRREGLYSSTLRDFRRQQAEGLLDPASRAQVAADKAARKTEEVAKGSELLRLGTENRRLKRQLQQAQIIIEFQKKLSELLGIPLESDPGGDLEAYPEEAAPLGRSARA